MRFALKILVVPAVFAACTETATAPTSTTDEDLTSPNGISINGISVNGISVNGTSLNGMVSPPNREVNKIGQAGFIGL